MTAELLNALLLNETDVDGALDRLSGDEDLYLKILAAFPADPFMAELERSIGENDWDSAFTAVHALKGLAGNLGFVPLSHSLGVLVILIRSGRLSEIDEAFKKTKKSYDDIVAIIKLYLD